MSTQSHLNALAPPASLFRLIEQSLIAWRVLARARHANDGGIEITGLGRLIRIERALPGDPFRYFVTVDGRRRPALSLVAVLRQVRIALDPAYAKIRVRIAAEPLLPPLAER